MLLARLLLLAGCCVVLLLPAWWLSGRIQKEGGSPFFRFLLAAGFALVGYLSFVGLVGRLLQRSILPAELWLILNALAALGLWWKRRNAMSLSPLLATWRRWILPLGVAVIVGLPQLLLAVSTNYFDEAASSAIHLTAPNQFAEGIFPPRHNALPDVPINYHYGFVILSGTVRWLTGLSANTSVDVASTALWFFIFLFIYFWLRQLAFRKTVAFWGGFAVLLGGGLSWLYQRRIEAYTGIARIPAAGELLHRYDPAEGWLGNLLANADAPSLHLRNADGSLSNLPWEITAQFQQHAVPLGIALTAVALFLFITWQGRKGWQPLLLGANLLSFGVLSLGHAVFGAVAAVTAGLFLLGSWLRRPTRHAFLNGACFGIGVGALTLAHGGFLARGPQYGAGTPATLRHSFGYFDGGMAGFLHWNLAGFGLPLLLALAAVGLHRFRRDAEATERNLLFGLLATFATISYLIPQLMYYSSATAAVEQFTEISKFFFASHFALALLSGFGVAYLPRRVRWPVVLPGFAAMAIVPLAFVYRASFDGNHRWRGFYYAPYQRHSIEQQMGEALQAQKSGPWTVYFDASADERNHGYLGEMLVFGGSVFTLTPSRYERTGVGYRLAEDVVARRMVQNSRMARLQPGAAEGCQCEWYYTRPLEDMTLAPILVRSRFNKLVAERTFVPALEAPARTLYSIVRPTADLDSGLDRYWSPRIVTQSSRRGPPALQFYDRLNNSIVTDGAVLALPDALRGQSLQMYVGRFPGNAEVGLLVGRMQDTEFHLGRRIEDLIERSSWEWRFRNPAAGGWQAEATLWTWDWDIPFVADLLDEGFDSHLAFRPRTGEWLKAPSGETIAGPATNRSDLPLPFGGRFLAGSRGDLGVWNLAQGTVTLRPVERDGKQITFRWGGREGDVLVPGDYDGDGQDEIAVWQRTNRTWYWRHAPEGPISQATFGTATSIPLPADYNGDGRLDLAYWEPSEGTIYVSLSQGRSVDRVIVVPPGAIPVFVNMI